MALETDDDRSAFLDRDEFAVAVTVTPANGDPARVFSAIFDRAGTVVDLGGELEAATASPSIFALESDLEALVVGDAVAVAGRLESYTVAQPPEPDGTGFARAALTRGWS